MKRIAIIGAGGHGKVAADIARLNEYQEIVFLDDDTSLTHCGSYCVNGTGEKAVLFAEQGYDLFIAVGNAVTRQRIQERLEGEKIHPVTLIHPSSVIGEDVTIGSGSVVMAGAVINSGSRIGKGSIINTCASVDHDCVVEDFVHISVGSHLAGTVQVGCRTWIGIGAVVNNNLSICPDCMIGAGAVVINHISESGVYVGVPAKMQPAEDSKCMRNG